MERTGPSLRPENAPVAHEWCLLSPWRSKDNYLIEKPGSCCIEMTCLPGRQGVHDCRWTTVGQEESRVGSSQPVGAQRPLPSSSRGVSESEERAFVVHQAYKSIRPGQRSCKSKELNRKPLTNPQNAPLEKNHLPTPPGIPAFTIARFSQATHSFPLSSLQPQ